MKKPLLKLILLFLATSCFGSAKDKILDILTTYSGDCLAAINKTPETKSVDTTIFPFPDKTFKLRINIFNTKQYNEHKKNATVTFSHLQNGKTERIFEDSFYCLHRDIELEDFNNDNVKDLLIFYNSGARDNPTFHLYLVDTLRRKLVYVKGFENLPNPTLDSLTNIITSTALVTGTDMDYKFYRINSKNKLIDLGYGVSTDIGDSVKYDRAINRILKKYGK